MKLTIEVDGESYSLDFKTNGTRSQYVIQGARTASGEASVVPIGSDVFSVLLGDRSFTVCIAPRAEALEVSTGTEHYSISLADARDKSAGSKKASAAGPIELRALMPGKVIKLLVEPGAAVHSGEGVIIVEAMKMQNEMKSPKNGVVRKIRVREGDTVAAGETLLVIE